jgi:glycosyltransferase involved in cell wall biosynthesis
MKVGFFAPLPPSQTGVADYAAALLAGLRKHGEVEVGSETSVPLYHLGNNHLHRAIYERALKGPGVVVLHDAVLHHFFLGTLGEERYQEEFVYNYGEWTRGLAEQLWRERARSAADPRYFDYPMLKRIAESARVLIVHNPAAARAVKRHAPDARVVEIPHLFAPPQAPDSVQTLRFRAALGLHPRTLLVGVFGHLRESKRLPVILRAMQCVWNRGGDVRLLVQGAFASSDLERAVAPLLADPRIIRVGHLPEGDFWRYAAAADLCINLRYPTAGESSGIAIRMMGIGKPVVFTAGEEVARIPDDACLRIDLGAGEEAALADVILWLARDREAAAEIGRRAAHHIAAEHSIEKVSRQYWDALQSERGESS